MEVDVGGVAYFAIFLGGPLILGALVRRWWVLGVAGVLFVAQGTYILAAGVDSRDLNPVGTLFVTAIGLWAPVLLGLAVGVFIGLRLWPRRGRRGTEN